MLDGFLWLPALLDQDAGGERGRSVPSCNTVDEYATPVVQLRGDEPGQPPNLIRWRFALDDRKVHQQLVSGYRLTGMGGRQGHHDIRAPIERDAGGKAPT
jgi:hypothetical protein